MIARPKAVVFDFGGTLMDDTFSIEDGVRHLHSILNEPRLSLEEYARADAEVEHAIRNLRSTTDLEYSAVCFASVLRDYLGLTPEFSEVQEADEFWAASSSWSPVEGAAEIVRKLFQADVPLAVLSNLTFSGEHVRRRLDTMQITPCFARIVTSADYGIRKPHPLPFTAVARRIGVSPNDCWYIGDTLETDILGAKRSGMTSVWLNRHGRSNETDVRPDLEVRDWDEFDRVWESLG